MSVYGDTDVAVPPAPAGDSGSANKSSNKKPQKTPQEKLAEFWDKFNTKKPGKITSIFPRSLYHSVIPYSYPAGAHSSRNAAESYEAAAKECRDKVNRIVRECNRTNEKFTDPDFDIEHDWARNCLNGLVDGNGGSGDDDSDDKAANQPSVSAWDVKNSLETLAQGQMLGKSGRIALDAGALSRVMANTDGDSGSYGGFSFGGPGSVHRVDWIFDSPQFTVNGYSSSDIKQGQEGDCWWLAAVATIAHRKDLMDRVCVARDEECGVYGFVFMRDGEWISTVVDDNLYLEATDFDFYGDVYDSTGKRARRYRKEKQTGSEALYFGHCEDTNETWLPLLEKAYAKAHGDYKAIAGGWPGEGVEDMTGGVTSTLESNRVLRKDKLWKELISTEGAYVFALAAMSQGYDWKRSGLALGHAYSILEAREEVGEEGQRVRLVLIRNPWGERGWNGIGEWNGPWSDGSKEWTPYWLKKFGHTFGDDGVFWMSFDDMLDNFNIHRTRLFDRDWTVVQQWASANISWVTGYLRTKFEIEIKKAGVVVLVLSQLDDRYFRGLEGKYRFELHFLLKEVSASRADHICRVRPVKLYGNRAVSCEVHLEPGKYEVIPKIIASEDESGQAVEDVVKEYAKSNPEKLRQVGMQYDLAHAKGGIPDEDENLTKKRREEEAKKAAKKRKLKEKKRREKAMQRAAEAMAKAADAIKDIVATDKSTSSDSRPSEMQTASSEGKNSTGNATAPEASTDPTSVTTSAAVPSISISGTSPESSTTTASPKDGVGASTAATSNLTPASVSTAKLDGSGDLGASSDQLQREEKKKDDEVKPDEDSDSDSDSDAEGEASTAGDADDADPGNPWNAVAVIGLRVYARDPDVTIALRPASTAETTTLVLQNTETATTSAT